MLITHQDQIERYISTAIRKRGCSCCGNTIEPGTKHFHSYGYNKGYMSNINVCEGCLRDIANHIFLLNDTKDVKVNSHTDEP